MNKEILRLAVPSMLANITIPLVGLVDVAIAGHIADASAIAGIAVASTLFDLLYWGFGFLRVGTGGMTAQAFGSGDKCKCAEILTQSTTIAITGAAVIWSIQTPFANAAMIFMDCSSTTERFAMQYFRIRIWAAPATLMLMTMKGWFVGMQDTVTTMTSDLTVNLTNMGLSYWMAVSKGMGAAGVAYGTLGAQYIGLAVTMVILVAKHGNILKSIDVKRALRWEEIKQLTTLNGNLFIRSICFMVVYVGFTKLTTLYGTTEIALGAIVMKLFMVFSYMVDGFAYAGEALTGKYIGSGERNKLRHEVKLIFVWSMGLAVVVSAVFGIWGEDIVGWIAKDEAIRNETGRVWVYMVLMPLVSAAAFAWDGIYAGATAGREIRNCMIVAVVGFVAVYFVCKPWAGVDAVYAAYFAHLVGRIAYLSVKYKKRIIYGSSI